MNIHWLKLLEDKGFKYIGIICDEKLFQNSEQVRNVIGQLEEQHEVFLKLYNYPFEPSYQLLDRLMAEIIGKTTKGIWMFGSV